MIILFKMKYKNFKELLEKVEGQTVVVVSNDSYFSVKDGAIITEDFDGYFHFKDIYILNNSYKRRNNELLITRDVPNNYIIKNYILENCKEIII